MENKVVKLYFELEEKSGRRYANEISKLGEAIKSACDEKNAIRDNPFLERGLEQFVSNLNDIRKEYKKQKCEPEDIHTKESLEIALRILDKYFGEDINKTKEIQKNIELTKTVKKIS